MASGTKVAVVTGSNKGIGLAIVRGLCRQYQGHVYLTSRDTQRGKDAIQKLEAEGLCPKFHQLDINSKESISLLKKSMLDTYGGVDVLINNAGIAYKSSATALPLEQVTVTVATNFTGTLNMMQAFVPIMKPHGRIVNVSSILGALSKLDNQDFREKFSNTSLTLGELVSMMDQLIVDVGGGQHEVKGWSKSFYSNSKIGMTALTKVFAREMANSGKEDILINACCPGWVKTDLAGDKAPLTPDQGAETPIFCALLPLGSPSGEFWKNKAVVEW